MSEPSEPADLAGHLGSSSSTDDQGVTHETIYSTESGTHISWDHREGEYEEGSGHTRNDNDHRTTSRWDEEE